MNIYPTYYNYHPQTQKTTFQGNQRKVVDNSGNFLYMTTTYFFRGDFDWKNFLKLLQSKYANTPKVNFINHSCSNGPEAYTNAINIIEHFGVGKEKFFPIIAKDINPENIKCAQASGQMGISNADLYRINCFTRDNISAYFNFAKATDPKSTIALVPKPEIREKIQFSQGDIFKDIETMPTKDTILFCRNFWPYLEVPQREVLATKLGQKFDNTSLIAIGEIDAKNGVNLLLTKNGFVETSVENVFTKPMPKYLDAKTVLIKN